jgi:hypothetical protein
VTDLSQRAWNESFPNLAPLATLETIQHERKRLAAGGLLAMGLQPGPCAVYLVTHLGRDALPVAKTLDAFIRGRLWTADDRFPPTSPGLIRLAFRWSERPIGLVPQTT